QSDYGATSAPAHPHVVTGNLASLVASRVAYAMDLSGPCMTVDTACSSSLTAIHLACESLRRGECELAIAGGVYVMSTANCARAMHALGLLSKSSKCRPFDANADGWALGEAVGAIVLKPLRKAIADRDSIHAVIRASGVNQSGRSQGVGAPRMDA